MSIFKSWLPLVIAAAYMAAFIPNAFGEDEFEVFFRAFKEKRDGIGSLQATFKQKTILPEEELLTEGVLYYSKPRRILFSTKNPERSLLVDGRRGYEYDAEIRQMTIFDIEDHPRADIFFLGFDNDTEMLRRAYDVTLLTTEDSRGRQGIKIKPRPDTDEAEYFIEVNLYLRDSDYLPYRIHIVNDEESQLFIDVEAVETIKAQDLQSARIFVPEGVKVIENDRVIDTVGPGGRYVPDAQGDSQQTVQDLPPIMIVPKEEPPVQDPAE